MLVLNVSMLCICSITSFNSISGTPVSFSPIYRHYEADGEVSSHVIHSLSPSYWVASEIFQAAQMILIGAVEEVFAREIE